ncbi:MAG: NAD(P)-dependent oxidoreductase [Sandaracinaceae bacterium]
MTHDLPPPRSLTLAVFGGTRGVGRALVERALADGHRVRLLARDASRVGDARPRLHVEEGDVLDPAAVSRTLEGVDAVVIALGAPALRDSRIREEGTRVVLDRMAALGIERLACVSVWGAAESRSSLPWFLRNVVFPLYLRRAVADHEAQEAIVRSSDAAWTIVRPPNLTDGPRTSDYHVSESPNGEGLTLTISREDVADLLLRAIASPHLVGRTLQLSDRRAARAA